MKKTLVLFVAFFLLLAGTLSGFLSPPVKAAVYSGGNGSSAYPYQIATPADWQTLMATTDDWDADFILTADIDLAGIVVTPIGLVSIPFYGEFDGNGHVIYNAVIDGGANTYVGLFGYASTTGDPTSNIHDLGMVNAAVTGTGNYWGCLVGRNFGTISNCYVTGSITGYDNVGGLVGANSGTITGCYAACDVSGRIYIGGLVGFLFQDVISDCYSQGTVSGVGMIAGLTGKREGIAVNTVTNCYTTGSVAGSADVNGLSPAEGTADTHFSYWNTDIFPTSEDGIGRTTAQMASPPYDTGVTYVGWDFTTVWVADTAGNNDGYPYLAWQVPEICVYGNGTLIADGSSTPSAADHTEFGDVNIDSGSVTRTYTIYNLGSLPLHLTGVTGDTDFTVTQPSSSTLATGGATTFTVTFDPASAGVKTATITVTSDDGDEGSYDFMVQGTGTAPPVNNVPAPEPVFYRTVDIGGSTATLVTDAYGKVKNNVTITSPNGSLTITIPVNTVMVAPDGGGVHFIDVCCLDSPPPPPENGSIIGLAYDFGPEGTIFAPPVTITVTYDPAALPEGVTAENLVLAFYDESEGRWIDIKCAVDTVNHTVTACIYHFCCYAVQAVIPAPVPTITETVTQPAVTVTVTPGPAVTEPVLAPTPTKSQVPVITVNGGPPKTTTGPVPALKEPDTNWALWGGVIGAVLALSVILTVYLHRRRD